MKAKLRYVGCRVNCYLFGIPKLGFSVPLKGYANPSRENTKLWHFPVPIRIVETKYHFDIDGPKLLSFSVRPNRKNTEAVFNWIQCLDGADVEIKEPYKETDYLIPYYDERVWYGEIYPEDKNIPPVNRDYRNQVIRR